MIAAVKDDSRKLTTPARFLLFGAGTSLLALLVVAAYLQPDPRGFGTHQQLGLPPCTIQSMFGGRCPSCGMTTSWSHFIRGHMIRSFTANSAGTLTAVLASICTPWLLASGLKGRWIVRPPHPGFVLLCSTTVVVVALVDWGVRYWIR